MSGMGGVLTIFTSRGTFLERLEANLKHEGPHRHEKTMNLKMTLNQRPEIPKDDKPKDDKPKDDKPKDDDSEKS